MMYAMHDCQVSVQAWQSLECACWL